MKINMQTIQKALIIFVRNPVLGKVKTRLAKDAGDENALAIYKELLQRTKEVVLDSGVDCFVFYADYLNKDDLWQPNNFRKQLQISGDLGARMQKAFEHVFSEGYKNVCIIGSDCAELSSAILEQAFTELTQQDVVVGPSLDGGYYLLGMKEVYAKLFSAKKWSTETVFSSTLEDIKTLNLSYSLLPKLSDIDYLEDWKRFKNATSS